MTKHTSSVETTEITICHVHDDAAKYVDEIRDSVCVKPPSALTRHSNGKFYCLFHLPSNDKPAQEFERLFRARLNEIESDLIRLESELPEKEIDRAKRDVRYDFRGLWFPSEVNLEGYKFNSAVDFSFATFTSLANFRGALFASSASFIGTNFFSYANFWQTTFLSSATFGGVGFTWAGFAMATFSAYAGFPSSIFLKQGVFAFAKFESNTEFTGAIFVDESEANFHKAEFFEDVFFDDVSFRNQADFSSAVFHPKSDVYFRRTLFGEKVNFSYAKVNGYLRFSRLQLKEKSHINFEESAFEKAARVTFHTSELRPSWFVNTDPRRFTFTDVEWHSLIFHWRNRNIRAELSHLTTNGIIEQSKPLLEIACRQLAANAEQNDRYEEASRFRYMANEVRRLGHRFQGRGFTITWWYKVSSGYGENWKRAFVVLLFLLFVVFPVSFATATFQICPNDKAGAMSVLADTQNPGCQNAGINCNCRKRHLALFDGEAIIHSLEVATFQNIDHRRAASNWAEISLSLEKILVPLQATLLALAIRRKFMR